MIKWAGRIFVFLGLGHTLGALVLTLPRYADAWFTAELWPLKEGIVEMGPAMGAFWLTTGSFGIPLIVVGLLVLWLDRRGIVPPPFVAWTLGVWSLLGAVMVEPAPWVLAWVAVGLLVAGARRSERAASVVPAP
ncbi:hypothetical protein ACIRNI_28865 [Streptomyces sp. NPDC093546]|uniref:hypothetical protein n=1 Tax=Streptomyces sp. NPDC093546 TaxID=3366040 RepID=UPI0037F78DDB